MKQTNQKLLFIGGIVLIMLIGAYFVFSKNNSSETPDIVNSENQTEAAEVTKTIESDKSKTPIQKLLSWSKSISLRCSYVDSMGDEVVTYIKNGAIRTHSLDPVGKEEGDAIVKDGWVYVWEKERGEGFKMTFDPNRDDKQTGDPNSYASFAGTDFVKQLENFQQSCIPTSVDDKLFELPPGISFMDYSELMEKIKNPQKR